MNRRMLVLTLSCAVLLGWSGAAWAEGFGTPVVDGTLDAMYGAAEATDSNTDGNGNAVMDLVQLYVVNDNDYWYFFFTVDANIATTTWGKYRLYIDTTNDAAGATLDCWGRNVIVNDPHKPEFSVGSWMDNLPYGPEDTQFWAWNQGTTSWTQQGTVAAAARVGATVSGVEWKIAKTALGDPAQIWCEVWSTGGGASDNAQDTCNDPAEDWNATDWATQAVLANSTAVLRQAGGDLIPPTLTNATTRGQDPITQIELSFSEPLQEASAETSTNYTIPGGIGVTQATLQADPSVVLLDVAPALGYGTCYSVTVRNVTDLAGNPIVNNGTTNVDCFKLFDLRFLVRLNLHLRDHTYFPEIDQIALEGGLAPLTWDPTCDHPMADADGDSVYVGQFQFCLPCSCANGNIEATALEYKYTHQCTEWEPLAGNHYYAFSDAVARDTLDVWWADLAPVDFTIQAMDVVWTLKMNFAGFTPVDGVDTVGVNGSVAPLTWDVPPLNELRDNGIAPDAAAGDDIWTTRITFPAGSYKNVSYKFIINGGYECVGEENRSLYLDDATYSQANPLVMPMLYFNICHPSGSVPDEQPRARLDLAVQPNPAGAGVTIAFSAGAKGRGEIAILDLSGRVVRAWSERSFAAGPQVLAFDGHDQRGERLASGVYFVRVRLNGVTEVRQINLLR